jgi:hypothetical protein
VAAALAEWGPRADDEGLVLGIENHQDFGSAELVALARSARGIGITFDTGNAFPVAEAPLAFAAAVAPHLVHLHLKDYRVQLTAEGLRLVRCAIGDGCVPIAGILGVLGRHHASVDAVLEPGALEARHVRLFTPGWWRGYPPRDAAGLAAVLLAVQPNRLGDAEDWRTPWERGGEAGLAGWELAMIRRSAANMAALGLQGGKRWEN